MRQRHLQRENTSYFQFFFDEDTNANQAAENVKSFMVLILWKSIMRNLGFVDYAPVILMSEDPIVENIHKIIEANKSYRHVSTVSISKKLNLAQKSI